MRIEKSHTASDNEHSHDVGVQKRETRRQDRRRNAKKGARSKDHAPSLDERDRACPSNKPLRRTHEKIFFGRFGDRISERIELKGYKLGMRLHACRKRENILSEPI